MNRVRRRPVPIDRGIAKKLLSAHHHSCNEVVASPMSRALQSLVVRADRARADVQTALAVTEFLCADKRLFHQQRRAMSLWRRPICGVGRR